MSFLWNFSINISTLNFVRSLAAKPAANVNWELGSHEAYLVAVVPSPLHFSAFLHSVFPLPRKLFLLPPSQKPPHL
jgi:hypothetical protein